VFLIQYGMPALWHACGEKQGMTPDMPFVKIDGGPNF
jgi:hypothetical protein